MVNDFIHFRTITETKAQVVNGVIGEAKMVKSWTTCWYESSGEKRSKKPQAKTLFLTDAMDEVEL